MVESEIYVDPDRLIALAGMLDVFSRDVDIELAELETALASLGATWQDDQYHEFRNAIRPVHRILDVFRNEVRKYKPKLEADAEVIRAYQRLNPRG